MAKLKEVSGTKFISKVKSKVKRSKKSRKVAVKAKEEDISFSGGSNSAESENDIENESVSAQSNETLEESKAMSHEEDSGDELDPTAHAQSLAKLKETDPEFYAFLEENDQKLLNFQVDSDASDNDDKEDIENFEDGDALHKPDSTLHEGSDDSDFEDGKPDQSGRKITLKMVKEWQKALQTDGKMELSTISTVVKAFHAALVTVCTVESDEENLFKVEGSGVFNAVVQMCVLYLQPALKKILRLQKSNKDPQKCKRWVKVKGILKSYFIDLFKLLGGITSTNILTILLKHLHQMSVFLGCFPVLAKVLFKRLTTLWSTSEETVRVLAFLCILRVTRNNQSMLLENILKMMYMTYVKNSKFVSPGTWPSISFMRRSLVEMFALDLNVSYQHVFLYIRQLAIHLRNAIILHKRENIQAVYNWQFVNSMQLWAELLTLTKLKPQLQSLVYPLVMIVANTIKLIPTAQYFPLRFHCTQILVNLSKDSEIFIPILPFILEALSTYDFGKKHKKVSMKPMTFSCILRLSKSQLSENGFKDAVIDNVYALLLETLSLYSHTISFPDMVIPCILQMKQFLKNCSVANYCRKIRQIVEKIEENVKFIESEKKKISFQLSDIKLINAWETTIKNNGTPMQMYYDNWNKLNRIQKRKRATKNDDISDKLPSIKRIKKYSEVPVAGDDGPVNLFPSDSEDDNKEEEVKPPIKKIKKKSNKKEEILQNSDIDPEETNDNRVDIVEDFNLSEW